MGFRTDFHERCARKLITEVLSSLEKFLGIFQNILEYGNTERIFQINIYRYSTENTYESSLLLCSDEERKYTHNHRPRPQENHPCHDIFLFSAHLLQNILFHFMNMD